MLGSSVTNHCHSTTTHTHKIVLSAFNGWDDHAQQGTYITYITQNFQYSPSYLYFQFHAANIITAASKVHG